MSDTEPLPAKPAAPRQARHGRRDIASLLELLALERIEVNLFRGVSPKQPGRQRIFGGQVLAQALMAAYETVDDPSRVAHSLHAYFLRPGDPKTPILFDVDRIRDGRSFTTRRVVAIQRGRAIFNMSVSFQPDEAGYEHQIDLEIPSEVEGQLYEDALVAAVREAGLAREPDDRLFALPVEIRAIDGLQMFDPSLREPHLACWARARGELPPDQPALHQAVAAYASDLTIMVPAVYPHPIGMMGGQIQSASLDHAMWFHRPLRADQWLLFVHESPVAARSRGFATARVYTREGQLVASCAQEGLIRKVAQQ